MFTSPSFLHWMDLLGTFVFAITGGFRAIKYELDILGVFSLATAVGVGGGMMRDVLLGAPPPVALTSHDYLITTCIAGLCVFFFAPRIAPSWRVVLYADAFGLALFAAIGAEKAFAAGLGPVGIMFIATIAAVGGGVIRDVLTGELPYIFTKEVYATATLLGGGAYWVAAVSGVTGKIPFVLAFVTVILLRSIALHWGMELPKSHKLPASPSQLAQARKEGRIRGQ